MLIEWLSVNVISLLIICVKCEICERQFSSWFWVKNVSLSAEFLVQLLKLRDTSINENSQHRNEVKPDSCNAENCYQARIFGEQEFTDPSLSEHFFSSIKYQILIWQISKKLAHSSQAWLEYAIFGFLLLLLTNALVNYIWKCYILHYHQIWHSSLTLQSFNYSFTIFKVNTVSKNLTRSLLIIYFCEMLS